MKHDLLGYLLKLDDPESLARVEAQLRADPELARQLAVYLRALAPLEIDRDPPSAPADLVTRTIARVASHAVETREDLLAPSANGQLVETVAQLTPERLRRLALSMERVSGGPSRWRRPDVAVVVATLIVIFGLILSAVPYVRHRQNIIACQNRMREFHQAFTTYSDTHEGHFPQVMDTPPLNTGTSFLSHLNLAGVLPQKGWAGCPAGDAPRSYSYSLGWRDANGQLIGLRRDPNLTDVDLLPILADRPPPERDGSAGPDHRTGQNVLFVGGHVRFCTDYLAGVNRDNIYRNDANLVGAGLHCFDSVMGMEFDHP